MMKNKLYWLPLMALILVGIMWLASHNQGYVLIVRHPYRIQISLNFLLILIALSFLGLHYSLRLMRFLRKLPENRRSKKEFARLKSCNVALLEGMHALAESDFKKAEIAVELAQKSIQNADLAKLIEILTTVRNKQNLPLE